MGRLFENPRSLKEPKRPGALPLYPKSGAYSWASSFKGQCAGALWVIAYNHKTQSFVKNGGQLKCLDKALK